MIWQISIREEKRRAAHEKTAKADKTAGQSCQFPEAEMLIGKTDFNIKPTTPQNNAIDAH